MGIEDEYAAFCLDETCLFMIQQARKARAGLWQTGAAGKAEGQAERDDQRRGGGDDSSADGLTH